MRNGYLTKRTITPASALSKSNNRECWIARRQGSRILLLQESAAVPAKAPRVFRRKTIRLSLGGWRNIRLEEDRQCILVLMGATADGKKELIAIQDGYRESEQSWKQLLLDVKVR